MVSAVGLFAIRVYRVWKAPLDTQVHSSSNQS